MPRVRAKVIFIPGVIETKKKVGIKSPKSAVFIHSLPSLRIIVLVPLTTTPQYRPIGKCAIFN
ncbi:Uncharacterised protein [Vibrio cholerae]|nr:Uncharacterised protein [Vibrio cholerae]